MINDNIYSIHKIKADAKFLLILLLRYNSIEMDSDDLRGFLNIGIKRIISAFRSLEKRNFISCKRDKENIVIKINIEKIM